MRGDTRVKLAIAKDGRCYFDGKFVSNGHWIALAGKVKLGRADLQGLVDAGVPFSAVEGRVDTGENAKPPDMERMARPPADRKAAPWQVSPLSMRRPGGEGWIRILLQGNTVCGIAEEYYGLTAGSMDAVLDAKGANWFMVGEDEWVTVMPVELSGLAGDVEDLGKVLAGEREG